MKDIMTLSCQSEHSDGVLETLRSLDTSFSKVYTDSNAIADFAMALKQQRNAPFCQLPFCHTLEAEAMGGDIVLGDDTAGARVGKFVYHNIDEIRRQPINLNTGRISKMLKACQILKSGGETVVFSISGPLSTFSCLLDITILFKAWRKDESKVTLLLSHYSEQLVRFADEICTAGADAISYADPVGIPKIIGPKYTEKITLCFTKSFLKKLKQVCNGRADIYLCPITAGVLKTFDLDELLEGQISSFYVRVVPACVNTIKPS